MSFRFILANIFWFKICLESKIEWAGKMEYDDSTESRDSALKAWWVFYRVVTCDKNILTIQNFHICPI